MNDDSKLSVNKMVEFAMELSMTSLFTQAMNNTFVNTARQFNNDQLNTPPKYIYAIIGGLQKGPFSLGEIMALIKSGDVTLNSYMWKPGMIEWKLAKDVSDINPGAELIPPQTPKKETL